MAQKLHLPEWANLVDFCDTFAAKVSGAQILRGNHWLTSDGVVTYCEWERTTIYTKI